MVNEAEVKVKSLQKALEILNCFTKKSSWGVTEISEQLDLNKSNVHNILTTFKAMGYLGRRMMKAADISWDSACTPCVILWDRT